MYITVKLITGILIILFSFVFMSTSLSSVLPTSLFAAKKIYKIVNEDGSITYSDTPIPGSEELIITVPTNNMRSQTPPAAPLINSSTQQKTSYTIRVLQPENEATIRNNLGKLTITATMEPVASGIYQLEINNQTIDSPTGVFQLTGMDRGAYPYSVKFIDNSGKIIASTNSRNVYLHQASALNN